MKNKNAFRKAFLRQMDENDCGLACLSMILTLAGKQREIAGLRENLCIPPAGLSLLELRNQAERLGLPAQCVQMDIEFLRENSQPCILHVLNEYGEHHFQVCFGAIKKRAGYQYLMADPARQVYLLAERELISQWQSKSAVYFDHFPIQKSTIAGSSWHSFLSINLYPKMLWVSVPCLHICSAIFGVTLSWVLQRWLDNPIPGGREALVLSILLLLLVITIFKSLLNFIKQQLLAVLNHSVQEQLMLRYIRTINFTTMSRKRSMSERSIQYSMAEIQKIQQAIFLFLSSILSDGSLLLLIISGIFYFQPVAGFINSCYIGILLTLAFKKQAGLSLAYAQIKELYRRIENLIKKELQAGEIDEPTGHAASRFNLYQQACIQYTEFSKAMTAKINKTNLLYEGLGAVNIIAVLAYGLFQLEKQSLAYSSVLLTVISSYLVSALTPKICNAFVVVAEGIDSSRQFMVNMENS